MAKGDELSSAISRVQKKQKALKDAIKNLAAKVTLARQKVAAAARKAKRNR